MLFTLGLLGLLLLAFLIIGFIGESLIDHIQGEKRKSPWLHLTAAVLLIVFGIGCAFFYDRFVKMA